MPVDVSVAPMEVGRALENYSAAEITRIKGMRSTEIYPIQRPCQDIRDLDGNETICDYGFDNFIVRGGLEKRHWVIAA